jgi:hypothetical protein
LVDEDKVQVQDPPSPDLADTLQRDITYPAVPVRVEGPVRTQAQPARSGPVGVYQLVTGDPEQNVLSKDLKRSRATLCAGVAWNYINRKGGLVVPWPANVPLVILHADEVWATGDENGVLSVITETYAD